jgi:hypothetical protein
MSQKIIILIAAVLVLLLLLWVAEKKVNQVVTPGPSATVGASVNGSSVDDPNETASYTKDADEGLEDPLE